jgi:hypothetical protein
MFYVIPDTLLVTSFIGFNNTFNNVSGITYDMLASFIGKVSLNTNKTGHHVLHYN